MITASPAWIPRLPWRASASRRSWRVMRDAVELSADLAELAHHDFFVAHAVVAARNRDRTLRVHLVDARRLDRHAGSDDVGELDHLADLDGVRAAQHVLRVLHVVAR